MADTPKDQDELTEEEAAKRRDEALKKALTTAPKPHKKPLLPKSKRNSQNQRGKKVVKQIASNASAEQGLLC